MAQASHHGPSDSEGIYLFVRTPAGERFLHEGAESLAIRERTCLRLADGRHDFRKLIPSRSPGRERMRRAVSQLMINGLIRPVMGENVHPVTKLQGAKPVQPAEALAGAKLALIESLSELDPSSDARIAANLVSAKSLRELAVNAQMAALILRDNLGPDHADRWWQGAKLALVRWRNRQCVENE